MKKIYPNLNSLRFIAASLVIVHHIELYKSIFGLPNYWNIPFFEIIGKLGVVLFFVLSGFLITSLLLHEIGLKGKISIKNFYLRRILRIWPLYYLVIFLGFFVFPYISFFDIPDKNIFPDVLENRTPNLFLYLTIFANLAVAIFKDVPYTSQTWSIATEEQFYLFWPLLFLLFRKKLLLIMIAIIVGYWLAKYSIDFKHFHQRFISGHTRAVISGFLYFFNINCMAIGGIFAVIVHKKSKILKFLFNKYLFLSSVLITIILLLFGVNFGFFHYDIYSILFAIIIVNLACNPAYSTTLENRFTNYLGSISYGTYMLHGIFLIISIRTAIYFNSLWIIYPLTFVSTFVVSHFSYKYFESYFLKLKSKFN